MAKLNLRLYDKSTRVTLKEKDTILYLGWQQRSCHPHFYVKYLQLVLTYNINIFMDLFIALYCSFKDLWNTSVFIICILCLFQICFENYRKVSVLSWRIPGCIWSYQVQVYVFVLFLGCFSCFFFFVSFVFAKYICFEQHIISYYFISFQMFSSCTNNSKFKNLQACQYIYGIEHMGINSSTQVLCLTLYIWGIINI